MSPASVKRWIARHPVAVVLVLSLLLQVALSPLVSVNHDTGLYLHDARMVARGHIPVLDYYSRSPLMHLILAPIFLLDVSPIVAARALMIPVTLALGWTVYLAARALHSHRAGVAACALFLLSPFVLIWGSWVKTEQVAGLIFLAGALPLLRGLDGPRIRARDLAILGAAIGAAFFVRRVVIIHLVVACLFLVYYGRTALGLSLRRSLADGLLLAGFSGVAVALGYLAWAGGSPADFGYLVKDQLLGLFTGPARVGSTGQPVGSGASPALPYAPSVLAGMVSERNVVVGVRTLLVTMPAVLLVLLYPVLAVRRRSNTRIVVASAAILAAFVALLGLWLPLNRIRTVSFLTVAALGLCTAVVFAVQREVDLRHVWSPKLVLPAAVAVFITLGYVVAGGRPFISQFQDAFPFVAILAGIVLYALWRRLDWRAPGAAVLGGVLVLGGVAAFVSAEPLVPGFGRARPDYINLTDVPAVGGDLRDRFGPDAVGFSAQHVHIVEAGHEVANQLGREYWFVYRFPESDRSRRVVGGIADAMRRGEVQYVLFRDRGERTEHVMSAGLEETFRQHYCPARLDEEGAKLYRRAGMSLYVYDGGAPESCAGPTPPSPPSGR